MSEIGAEPEAFMRRYEQATNTHDVDQVVRLIDDAATYWFTDGSFRGRREIAAAISRTFDTIADEVYRITDLEWVAVSEDLAVCRYRFAWSGTVDGKPRSGEGRGTNVLGRRVGTWTMLHEHLSA